MNLYDKVTQDIIAQLEKGTKPWTKSWKSQLSIPYNAVKKAPYRGINILILWSAAQERGYLSNAWMGYVEATSIGANVRKGERGTKGIFFNWKEEEKNGETVRKPFVRAFTVFNVAQLENLPEHFQPEPEPLPENKRMEAIYAIINNSGIPIGPGEPAYYPGQDRITMPPRKDFRTEDDWASTLLHELSHATGHKSRLNRKFEVKDWERAKALEECTAEMSAAFCCAALNYSYDEACSPAYIEHWLDLCSPRHNSSNREVWVM